MSKPLKLKGNIRRFYEHCPDCKGLGQQPVKMTKTKGETLEWQDCDRCKGQKLELVRMEELTNLYEEDPPSKEGS